MTHSSITSSPTQVRRQGIGEVTTKRVPRQLVLPGSLLAFASLAFATIPAAPAQAVGNCTANRRAWAGSDILGVHLQRTTNCRYYAKLVMDHPNWGVGSKFTFKVERQVR